jgi:hypothetical protein
MVVKVSKPEINVREKISELDKPSGTAGQAMLAAETPQEQFNLISAGRRNLIINGNFSVSQRGAHTSASGVSNGVYYLDRWKVHSNVAGTLQDTGYKVKVVATSTASGILAISQSIEDKNIHPHKGKVVTVSCKVTSNSSNARIVIYADDWMALGSQNDVHSGGGNEETLSATFTVPSNLSGILQVRVGFENAASNGNPSVSTNDYFEVSEVQLELGKVASPFEHRSYGEELALCQRYFQTNSGNYAYNEGIAVAYSNTYLRGQIQTFPVTMRITPTMTISNGEYFNNGWYSDAAVAAADISADNFATNYTKSGAFVQRGGYPIQYGFTADAEL